MRDGDGCQHEGIEQGADLMFGATAKASRALRLAGDDHQPADEEKMPPSKGPARHLAGVRAPVEECGGGACGRRPAGDDGEA